MRVMGRAHGTLQVCSHDKIIIGIKNDAKQSFLGFQKCI